MTERFFSRAKNTLWVGCLVGVTGMWASSHFVNQCPFYFFAGLITGCLIALPVMLAIEAGCESDTDVEDDHLPYDNVIPFRKTGQR